MWAAGWFSSISWYAIYGLRSALHRASYSAPGVADTVGIALLWLLMVAPAARASLADVARWSVWLTKVSFCAIVGLLLSTAPLFPQAIESLDGRKIPWRYLLGLEPSLLLWTVPPLLLGVPLMAEHLSRRGRWIIFGAGITLPLGFGILAALLTTAGATTLGALYAKSPSYLATSWHGHKNWAW